MTPTQSKAKCVCGHPWEEHWRKRSPFIRGICEHTHGGNLCPCTRYRPVKSKRKPAKAKHDAAWIRLLTNERDRLERRCEAAESALRVIARMKTGLERGKFGGHPDELFFEARSLAKQAMK